jgi:adenosylcobyric acid synthase
MIQGTSADVGKSLLVAGLCRAYTRRGLRVRPFKAQNMSNNAAVAIDPHAPPNADGSPRNGEIGRAQALQARACRAPNIVQMNPVLLKPQSDVDAQVVVQGRSLGVYSASDYQALKGELLPAVLESLDRLAEDVDLVIIEGAGSGSERYLRAYDIANMGLAEAADLPVVLLGDDSRGGVMAAVLGSHALWTPGERARVVGYLVNKFRGDPQIFAPACDEMTRATGWPSLGLVSWIASVQRLPPEDSLALVQPAQPSDGGLIVAVPQLPRIANFDDIAPLAAEPSVSLRWIPAGKPLPRDADVVILPGSKATRSDLQWLFQQGLHHDIRCHVRHGGRLVGLCGGFQMLGQAVHDPLGVEGPPGSTQGLGLLDIETHIGQQKHLIEIDAIDQRSGQRICGYEMHMGRTTGAGLANPWLLLEAQGGARSEGAESRDGRVSGTYIHGLFSADGFRRHWLAGLDQMSHVVDYEGQIEATLDTLADQLEADLDLDQLLRLAR